MKELIIRIKSILDDRKLFFGYLKKYFKYSFINGNCKTEKQYQASIVRYYHTIEKGLTYEDYRPGFGKNNINCLIDSMAKFSKQYGTNYAFYNNAISCLNRYVEKNKENGYVDSELELRINCLNGVDSGNGGVIEVSKQDDEHYRKLNFKEIMKTRHSIRHFSDDDVSLEKIEEAIEIAQYTPSACNRQGWKTIVINDSETIRKVLKNQNGNRGFGETINKLLVVTVNIEYFNNEREIFQPYIDGGMYASNLLNSLYYCGLASVPLSASLTQKQEKEVREIIKLDDSDVIVLFVGVGNYKKINITTKSKRFDCNIQSI